MDHLVTIWQQTGTSYVVLAGILATLAIAWDLSKNNPKH